MRKVYKYIITTVLVFVMIFVSIFAPAVIAKYSDKNIVDAILSEDISFGEGGYKYQLSGIERIYIFSKARENLSASGKYTASSLKIELLRLENLNSSYLSEESSYSLFLNQRGNSDVEYSKEEIIEICKGEIEKLKEISFLQEIYIGDYEAALFSIANTSDPSENISVWEISGIGENYTSNWQFEMDALTGKIYDFKITPKTEVIWEELDVDQMVLDFCNYLEVTDVMPYEEAGMAEKVPYYNKYVIKMDNNDGILITAGLNPVNNEFFIRMP